MKINFKRFTLLILISLISSQTYALPTHEDADTIVNICSGGKSSKLEVELEFSLKKWITSFDGRGEASTSELGAIFNEIEDENIKKDIFSTYHNCVLSILKIDKEVKIENIEISENPSDGNRVTHTYNGPVGSVTEGNKYIYIDEVSHSGSGDNNL